MEYLDQDWFYTTTSELLVKILIFQGGKRIQPSVCFIVQTLVQLYKSHFDSKQSLVTKL